MTRPYSMAFKQKMVERLTGKDAISAYRLSQETGVRQQNLSRWLHEARNRPLVEADKSSGRKWTVEQKARLLADASGLNGEELMARLEREGVTFAEFEQWRLTLEEGGMASVSTSRQIRKLERELARKEKALAEAAALLVLKKRSRAPSTTRTKTPTRRASADSLGDRQGTGVGRQAGTSVSRRRYLCAHDPALT